MRGKLLNLIIVFGFFAAILLPIYNQASKAQSAYNSEGARIGKICEPGMPCQVIGEEISTETNSIQTENFNIELRTIGGPDNYGYIWDDSVAYDWVDISGGTSTGFSSIWDITGAISLPFIFPFYGNSYSNIYITAPGYLTFFQDASVDAYGSVLDGWFPHNIIAPFWSIFEYPPSSSTGSVYYQWFDEEPNSYFVVQWDQLQKSNGDLFTFQAILYEDGDIKFQYQEMPTSVYSCASAGIEDSEGIDGLVYLKDCSDYPLSGTAVYFTRPEPSARFRVNPAYLGEFVHPSKNMEFIFSVENRGDLGVDVFEFDFPLEPSWSASLFNADTGLPLVDTNMNTTVDTGEIQPQETIDVLVQIKAPENLISGEIYLSSLEICSSRDETKIKSIPVEFTVPQAYTQSYNESTQNELNLIWPDTQLNVVLGEGNVSKVIETPSHNYVVLWSKDVTMPGGETGNVLHYAVLSRIGKIIKSPTIIQAPSGSIDYYSSDSGSIAVAPDGTIGILWSRYIINPEDEVNHNMWFMQMDSSGLPFSPPVKLTNNTVWYPNDGDRLSFDKPRISSTADNRFMLVWERSFGYFYNESRQADLYYSIRTTNGDVILEPIKMTSDHNGGNIFDFLTISGLSENRFYVAYLRVKFVNNVGYFYLLYRVFDSNGNQLMPYEYSSAYVDDVIQFSNGNILLSGTFHTGEEWEEGYRLLDENFNTVFSSPAGALFHPASSARIDYVFVTKGNEGEAILTWTDIDGKYIFYANVDNSGNLITGPSIARTAGKDQSIFIGIEGYTSTTNSWQPPNAVDLLTSVQEILYSDRSANVAELRVDFANQGLVTATKTQLEVYLPAGLIYLDDTSGKTPIIDGNTIRWAFEDLEFAENKRFSVNILIPEDVAIGTVYDLSLEISSDEVDYDPSNNTYSVEIKKMDLLFLPIILK